MRGAEAARSRRPGGPPRAARPAGAWRLIGLCALAALVGSPLPAAGSGPEVRVVAESGLAFGRVIGGEAIAVRPGEPGSGRWRVEAPAGTSVILRMHLPDRVRAGGRSLRLVFGAQAASWAPGADPARATRFDPSSDYAVRVPEGDGGPGVLYVWLGGRALVAPTQKAGGYHGRVSLEALPLAR